MELTLWNSNADFVAQISQLIAAAGPQDSVLIATKVGFQLRQKLALEITPASSMEIILPMESMGHMSLHWVVQCVQVRFEH
eukprot:CAMPEP_0117864668 /NCGR_PEP_ID=MMETSP0950-20121206/6290_1 /TAXON_ID=44440 /ORGANISM="Chattonella subsalsa, Strain CCMP2191" /LENGTH=80 /DNA_ID=CAMNT_0005715625 /DNA_START=256 /DNA_END=498 /DNA_ORIENTATION=+